MFKVKVLLQFKDLTTKRKDIRQPGDEYIIKDKERLDVLLGNNPRKAKFVEVIEIEKQCPTTKTDKKIIVIFHITYNYIRSPFIYFNLIFNIFSHICCEV